jgi:hypothetical protein
MDLRIPFEEDDLGIDLNDSTMDALSSEFGCAGVVGMTSVLPIALVSGMMLIRRKKETSQEK